MIYTNIFDINSWTLLGYSPDYLHYFKHNPQTGNPRYDLLGYDLTNYTVQLLEQDNENSFKQRAIQTDFEGIQSKIKCIPVDNGGCINNHIQIMTTN